MKTDFRQKISRLRARGGVLFGVSAVLTLPFFAGCTGARSARNDSAERITANHETTIRRALTSPAPLPTSRDITVSGTSNVVTIVDGAPSSRAIPPAVSEIVEVRDGANTHGTASVESATQTKFGLSMAGAISICAISTAALLVAFVCWRRGSETGRVADESIAQIIRGVRVRLQSTTDAEEIASLSPLMAELEAARGKLRR